MRARGHRRPAGRLIAVRRRTARSEFLHEVNYSINALFDQVMELVAGMWPYGAFRTHRVRQASDFVYFPSGFRWRGVVAVTVIVAAGVFVLLALTYS